MAFTIILPQLHQPKLRCVVPSSIRSAIRRRRCRQRPTTTSATTTSRLFASIVDGSSKITSPTNSTNSSTPNEGGMDSGTAAPQEALLSGTSISDFDESDYQERSFFRYELLHQSTKSGSLARVGRIHTPHGIIDTPGYVAVATNGALKGVDFRTADNDANQQLIFANTYHLLIHPGSQIIQQAGGIHQWTNRMNRPFITDSGGFQVFSLAYGSVHEELSSKGELKRSSSSKKKQPHGQHSDMVTVTEEGVVFRSYRDGSRLLLTPESTVQAQKDIGADIIIPLDELPPYHTARDRLVVSVDRTHRWETRSLKEHLKNIQNQAMYAVIHGGIDRELRTKSVDYLTSLPFDGYAIGGSLGNGREELKELLTWMMPLFENDRQRSEKPRHLLGIADEESIWNAAMNGIDTMDSCYPTRIARHGNLLVRRDNLNSNNNNDSSSSSSTPDPDDYVRAMMGTKINIKNRENARAFGVKIDDECQCTTCQHYDRAYLWHLFKVNEPIATTLAAQHNIHYMNDLMGRIRQAIYENRI